MIHGFLNLSIFPTAREWPNVPNHDSNRGIRLLSTHCHVKDFRYAQFPAKQWKTTKDAKERKRLLDSRSDLGHDTAFPQGDMSPQAFRV